MKFCLITNLYPPYVRGGAERVVELLVQGLRARGEVLLITTQPDDILDDATEEGFEIYRINPLNSYYLLDEQPRSVWDKIKWHWSDFFNPWVQKEIYHLLKKRRVDVVLTHNLKGLSLGLPKVIRKLGLPHIHTLHDYQLLEPHGSMFRSGQNVDLKGMAYVLYRWLSRYFFKNPGVVISPSRFALDLHLKYGFFKKSKTMVLPNPAAGHDQLKIKPRLTSDKLRLLYLGQLEPAKGVLWLAENFSQWDDARVELTIAGEGSQLAEIKKMAGPRIKVLGKVTRENLAELFARCDLLVLPSIWQENSPLVIYEAYQHGLPVLVADAGGAKELVKEGETGWVFKANNQADLLAKLKLALAKKDSLSAMGQAGRAYVQQFFLNNYLTKLIALCENLKK
ncbi:MAG: glycosyltransferase family 4 protein [Candidatus Komeilibacteria bacterium]|nr:glycosyltransferase family 4 protein [Candidatus Komeilibacteria bacterium]